jgi:hypothetical protein
METRMATDSPTLDQDTRVAFLAMQSVDKDAGLRGGVLVTDGYGKPLEFRATAPVRPNGLQRTLYGQTLMPHIAVELIGLPLLRSIQEKPSLVIIKDKVFFNVRFQWGTPLVRLWRQGEEVRLQANLDEKQSATVLNCATGGFQPIVSEGHRQFREDLESCTPRLQAMFATWDLIEPFDRIARAIESLHAQKALDS